MLAHSLSILNQLNQSKSLTLDQLKSVVFEENKYFFSLAADILDIEEILLYRGDW